MLIRRLFFAFGLAIIALGANAQTVSSELVSSSGSSFKNLSYQLDWSIGECVTVTHNTNDLVLTQGFHQNTNYIITSIENLSTEIEMSVYPNPTSDQINLKIKSSKPEGMHYTLTDLSGKLLATDKLLSAFQTLDFTSYKPGNYLITVSQNNRLLKSFQIVKK